MNKLRERIFTVLRILFILTVIFVTVFIGCFTYEAYEYREKDKNNLEVSE